MYETSEVEIGVQISWDCSLAVGRGGSMDIAKRSVDSKKFARSRGVSSETGEDQMLMSIGRVVH